DTQEVTSSMDYGPQLGRRFRALKMWFLLRYFGREGLGARIREHIRLSAELKSWIETSSDWEMMAPAPFSLVCFRARPSSADYSEEELEKLNTRLLEAVNRRGKVFLSHTKLNGRDTLRLAIRNSRKTAEHVQPAW